MNIGEVFPKDATVLYVKTEDGQTGLFDVTPWTRATTARASELCVRLLFGEHMYLRKFLAAAFVLLILGGCNNENNTNSTSEFDVTIKTLDKLGQVSTSFVQGDEINMVLSIKNISPDGKTLSFPSSKQYDFVIKDRNDAEVWRWSDGKFFSAVFSSYDIASGETKIFSYQWDQTISGNGVLIPIGRYILEAEDIGVSVNPKQDLDII